MKCNPIIIINEGCSMSSFTIKTIADLLKLHKYDICYPEKTELYKTDKNPYYKEGMNLADMLKKTFEEIPNVIMKLNMYALENEKVLKVLENQNGRVCFINRDNLLDYAICCTKDFSKGSPKQELYKKNFSKWRKSDERAKKRVDSSNLISVIKNKEKINMQKLEIMQNVNKVCNNQDRFISAQKLCNFDIHEYAKVFEVLGYDFKEELATKYFCDLDARQPYKHKDVIQQEDIDDFKSELKKHGFFKYWRD